MQGKLAVHYITSHTPIFIFLRLHFVGFHQFDYNVHLCDIIVSISVRITTLKYLKFIQIFEYIDKYLSNFKNVSAIISLKCLHIFVLVIVLHGIVYEGFIVFCCIYCILHSPPVNPLPSRIVQMFSYIIILLTLPFAKMPTEPF